MKILIEKAVIEQALEALGGYDSDFNTKHYDLITALREALDPELQFVRDWNEGKVRRVSDGKVMGVAEQAEQEPVAWMNDSTPMGVFARHKKGAENFGCTIPLYTAPVRTKDLTDDEISVVFLNSREPLNEWRFARAVIAKDREKNNVK